MKTRSGKLKVDRERALIRKLPAYCRNKIPCRDCEIDKETGERPEECYCGGTGLIPGDFLIPHPDCVDSAIRCLEAGCGVLLVHSPNGWVCPAKLHGRLNRDVTVRAGIHKGLDSSIREKLGPTTLALVIDKKVASEGRKWFRILRGRARWMYRTGLGESAIAKGVE